MTTVNYLPGTEKALALIKELGKAILDEKKLNEEYVNVLYNNPNPSFDEDGMRNENEEESRIGKEHWAAYINVLKIKDSIKIFSLQLQGEDTTEMEKIHDEVYERLLNEK